MDTILKNLSVLFQAEGEEVVREAFPSATIVRPADIYGYEDRFLRYYASLRVFPMGIIPLLKGGKGVYKRPIYVSRNEGHISIRTLGGQSSPVNSP